MMAAEEPSDDEETEKGDGGETEEGDGERDADADDDRVPDVPADTVDEAERLTPARPTDRGRGGRRVLPRAARRTSHRSRLRPAAPREEDDTLVLYPDEWMDDGTVQLDRIETTDRAVEVSLSGPATPAADTARSPRTTTRSPTRSPPRTTRSTPTPPGVSRRS